MELSLCNSHYPGKVATHNVSGATSVSVTKVLELGTEVLKMRSPKLLYDRLGRPLTNDRELMKYLQSDQSENNSDSPNTVYISNGVVLENEAKETTTLNVAMLGDGAVGKSALTLRYCESQFIEGYNPTIEDSFVKVDTIDGSKVSIDILDTAGQDDFKTLRTSWMRDKHALIFVYDITQEKSIIELEKDFYQHMCDVYEDTMKPVLIVVGNKVDLDNVEALQSEDTKKNYNRRVQRGDAALKAKTWGGLFYETSALTGFNVREIFATAAREAISRMVEKEPPVEEGGGCCILL